ncbi:MULTISPECIES: Fur family transcriptional regulator [unclassified Nocardioides]|uniref:Fur family transcriptional regulator n=1 Tax=unclassified Nocardioides TaxID=2615069 RepID=UPI0006F53ACC|nr:MULTISPECIES: Fur family transcriptional regulator [unclassified Nocardioides]KQY61804.1 Fur family transcriptional regulator [Nocardioides sp. Root140]KQZ70807.1 Fur family transcriptional regulator [Nocardioides sp. Root151]KRF10862.1 Fur family transcriptional regulator [Nocardioides sp. Soil796]
MTNTEPKTEPTTEPRTTPVAGGRPTKQRLAVANVLSTFGDFRSAQEIHSLLTDSGEKVGLATVYRTLQLLADSGEVDVLRTEDGEAAYRRCSDSHHHHLVCRSCGATVEVEGPTVERWTKAIAAEHGYRDISHTLEIFGTCAACS